MKMQRAAKRFATAHAKSGSILPIIRSHEH